MSCAMVSVMLLVRILLWTLHSINLRPCLLSSVSLGDKRSLSLGELIRPICITILYHNLPLFIDICLIMRYYLWLFICLCMLDDSWRMDCRSLDSDGKEGVSVQFREDQKNTKKIWENIIFPEEWGSQKEEWKGAAGGPHPLGAGPPDPTPRVGLAHLLGLRLRSFAYIFPTEP